MITVPDQVQGTEPEQKPAAAQPSAAPLPIVVTLTQPPKSEAEREADRQIVELTAALARFTEHLLYATAILGMAALVTLGALIWQGYQMKRIADAYIRAERDSSNAGMPEP